MHHLESSLENMSKMFGGVNKTHTRVDGIVYALCSWIYCKIDLTNSMFFVAV